MSGQGATRSRRRSTIAFLSCISAKAAPHKLERRLICAGVLASVRILRRSAGRTRPDCAERSGWALSPALSPCSSSHSSAPRSLVSSRAAATAAATGKPGHVRFPSGRRPVPPDRDARAHGRQPQASWHGLHVGGSHWRLDVGRHGLAAVAAQPGARLAAQYRDVGVKHTWINASGGRSVVEQMPGQINGYRVASGWYRQASAAAG